MKKSSLNITLALVFGVTVMNAHAATLNMGDRLTLSSGVTTYDSSGNQINVSSGSWFMFDGNADRKIQGAEKTALTQGTDGIIIGSTQAPGAINAADSFWFSAPANFYTTTPVTGDTLTGLDMTGWNMVWSGTVFPFSSGAWNPLNATAIGVNGNNVNGIGKLTWDGIYGHDYTLDYSATATNVGFVGSEFYFHLTGTVQPVPLPAAAWLLGSGLLGLIGVTRKLKRA